MSAEWQVYVVARIDCEVMNSLYYAASLYYGTNARVFSNYNANDQLEQSYWDVTVGPTMLC